MKSWKTPSVVGPLVGATTRPPIPPGQLRVEEEPEVPGLGVPLPLQVEVPGLQVLLQVEVAGLQVPLPLQVEVPGLQVPLPLQVEVPGLQVPLPLQVEVPGLDPNLEVNLGVEVPGLDPNLEIKCPSLTVPYSMTLPSGVYDKMLITIAGTIKSNADMFTVDLKTPTDLAFHFNPRFNEGGKKVIVRNSCISKKWGKEERDLQNFPFIPGQPFEVQYLIYTKNTCSIDEDLVHNKEFKVAVNNSHVLTFHHRVSNLRSINTLNIFRDVTLSKVNVETMP
ncbi:Galectin-3 [Dissostichus eleginoides]|uniref:Galectin n=1 Tax=Dissostichus eleginoides TaxID=100907 RepID=A0AAD9END6_DISEL|nr:Galectin-3 [Dissostichus eleginoides]